LKYAPAAMGKTTSKGLYANAAPKDVKYGSIIVVSSVASGYGGCGGPAHTIASHAALGVVRSGVPVLRGTGVRINCIAAGQIRDEGTESKSDSEFEGVSSSIFPILRRRGGGGGRTRGIE
jgi:NAD(P)-dependent dehydrogenase (short-subunit alcohol dehydrogenase family)